MTDEATKGVRMDRMARQLAGCLDNNTGGDRLRKEDIFSLQVTLPAKLRANRRAMGRLSFKVTETPSVKQDVVSALAGFLFDHDGDPATPNIPLHKKGESEVMDAPSELNNGEDEIFKGSAEIFSLLLVVEGGPGTLDTVKEANVLRTPVVVIEGSGRIADVLAYAWRFLHDDSKEAQGYSRGQLQDYIREVFPRNTKKEETLEAWDTRIEAATRNILQIVVQEDSMTIYTISSGEDIDAAMLRAMLLSVKPATPNLPGLFEVTFSKLHLSMLFNRPEPAQTFLRELRGLYLRGKGLTVAKHLRGTTEKTLGERYGNLVQDALYWAVVGNHVEFVRMFLPEVKDICGFLYAEGGKRLYNLYEQGKRPYFQALKKEAKKRGANRLLGAMQRRDSKKRLSQQQEDMININKDLTAADQVVAHLVFAGDAPAVKPRDIVKFYDEERHELGLVGQKTLAYNELMTWSVIMGYGPLSEIFWQEGGDSIASALLCSRMFSALSTSRSVLQLDSEAAIRMEAMARTYEGHAHGVLDSSYMENNDNARALLRLPLQQFRLLSKHSDGSDPVDCTELAHLGGNLDFFSHSAVQSMLLNEWYGHMDIATSQSAILFNIFVPFVLNNAGPLRIMPSKAYHRAHSSNANLKSRLSNWRLMYAHVTAPVTKFYMDCLSFTALLFLYSWVALSPLVPRASAAEWVLIVWMSVLALEELRQVVKLGLRDWQADAWNRLDFLLVSEPRPSRSAFEPVLSCFLSSFFFLPAAQRITLVFSL